MLQPAGTALLVAHAAAVAKVAGTAVLVAHATAVAEVATTAVAVLHAATVLASPALADGGPPQPCVCFPGFDAMWLGPLVQDFHAPPVGPGAVAVAESGPCTATALESVERTALHWPFFVVTGRHPDLLALGEDAVRTTVAALALHGGLDHRGGIGRESLRGEFLGGLDRFWDSRSECS